MSLMEPPAVVIAEDQLVVIRKGVSQRAVATILGRERDLIRRAETIWLDRIVHVSNDDHVMEGERQWDVRGAISTILTSALPPD